MEFEDKKNKYFVPILVVSLLILIAVVFVIISFLNKETEIKQINQPQKPTQQEGAEEQKNVNDYINVIYTGNGFVPPIVISSEQKINFKNITSEDIELMVSQNDNDQNDSNLSQTMMVSSDGSDMQNFLPGEYTVTVVDSEDQINILIKN